MSDPCPRRLKSRGPPLLNVARPCSSRSPTSAPRCRRPPKRTVLRGSATRRGPGARFPFRRRRRPRSSPKTRLNDRRPRRLLRRPGSRYGCLSRRHPQLSEEVERARRRRRLHQNRRAPERVERARRLRYRQGQQAQRGSLRGSRRESRRREKENLRDRRRAMRQRKPLRPHPRSSRTSKTTS